MQHFIRITTAMGQKAWLGIIGTQIDRDTAEAIRRGGAARIRDVYVANRADAIEFDTRAEALEIALEISEHGMTAPNVEEIAVVSIEQIEAQELPREPDQQAG